MEEKQERGERKKKKKVKEGSKAFFSSLFNLYEARGKVTFGSALRCFYLQPHQRRAAPPALPLPAWSQARRRRGQLQPRTP